MWKNKPEVKIIADSINEFYERITTFELHYWRPLLPEMNTHRVFSRNAASSRAQSFQTRCMNVWQDPHLPCHWNAEQLGMTGGEEFTPEVKDYINERIKELAQHTVQYLEALDQEVEKNTGNQIHKQYLNRYLEPFTTVTQLVTSTDWGNFFKLRMAQDAQPEIQDLAYEMYYQMSSHTPTHTTVHLPYIQPEERLKYSQEVLEKISVARCARVSYKPYTGDTELKRDLKLYDRLLKNGHMSPFEHIAFAAPNKHCYNLNGWKSLRYVIDHSDSGSTGGV